MYVCINDNLINNYSRTFKLILLSPILHPILETVTWFALQIKWLVSTCIATLLWNMFRVTFANHIKVFYTVTHLICFNDTCNRMKSRILDDIIMNFSDSLYTVSLIYPSQYQSFEYLTHCTMSYWYCSCTDADLLLFWPILSFIFVICCLIQFENMLFRM